jgi:hypothetical protein
MRVGHGLTREHRKMRGSKRDQNLCSAHLQAMTAKARLSPAAHMFDDGRNSIG